MGRDKSVVMMNHWNEEQISPLDSLKAEDLICQCHTVTKGAIFKSISVHQLKDLEEVKKQTGAATGCGGCQELVRACYHVSSNQLTEALDTFLLCAQM